MKDGSTKPGPRYEASLELLQASEALWNASRIFLERWNLSPSQFNILNLLRGQATGFTQIELSRQLIMHRSNVTGLVDRLEARRLVQRRDSRSDRRVFNVVLTRAGTALMRKIEPHYYRAAEGLWGGLSVRRAKRLAAEVAAISANAERIAVGAAKTGVARRTRSGKSDNARPHPFPLPRERVKRASRQ